MNRKRAAPPALFHLPAATDARAASRFSDLTAARPHARALRRPGLPLRRPAPGTSVRNKGFRAMIRPSLSASAALVALVLGLGAGPAMAQQAPAEGPLIPGAGLPLGEEMDADAMGATYVAEEFGDWTKVCQRVPDGSDPCGLTQLIADEEGSPVAEITIFALPPGGEAVAAANVITPLGTVLTAQLSLQVDGGQPRRYPFFFCDVGGCYAQLGLTAAVVESFRRGSEATITIASVLDPEQPIALPVSLMGFTAGFSALPR